MVQVIRVYNTEENALIAAADNTGMIVSKVADSNGGCVCNGDSTNNAIPYYVYNKYYYRIDANEPVSEFHIDWDDGEDNSTEKANIQIIKNKSPTFYTVVEHIYTEAKRYFPLIRTKSIDGYISKWYTNDGGGASSDNDFVVLEPFTMSALSHFGNNQFSQVSMEKQAKDLIPHFIPASLPPVGILKTDKKQIFAGIDNKHIEAITGGTTYPLLYIYTNQSSGSPPSVKLTVQGRNDRATREYTIAVANIVTENADLDTEGSISTSEFAVSAVPTGNYGGSTPTLTDCADKLLRAELLNATTLGDDDRIYIKVFDADTALDENVAILTDATVCVLSNGNPIVDLNDTFYNTNIDGSESFSRSSNIDISTYYLDDDSLNIAAIQTANAPLSNLGNVSDSFAAGLSLGTVAQKKLSYSYHNISHTKDSNNRFYDFHRLLRLQVGDNHTIHETTVDGDFVNRRSWVEHYDDDNYVSTMNSGSLRVPSSEQTRGLLLFSNDNDPEESYWQDIGTTLARNTTTMVGGGSTYRLRYDLNDTTSSNIITEHPKNHIFLCKTDKFDSVYFRLENTYTEAETAADIDITAYYSTTNGWEPLEIIDNTLGLKTSGSIQFQQPSNWEANRASTIESGTWSGPVPAASSEEVALATSEIFTIEVDNSGDGQDAFSGSNEISSTAAGAADDGLTTSNYGNYFTFSSTTVNYYAWMRQAAVKETTLFTIDTDLEAQLNGSYVVLYDSSGASWCFWFTTSAGGSAPLGFTYTHEVDISTAADADAIATILDTHIETGGGTITATAGTTTTDPFTSSVSTDSVTVILDIAGVATDSIDNTARITTTTSIQGKNLGLDPAGKESSLSGKTAVPVDYDDGDSATDMATEIRSDLGGISGVTTGGSATTVTVTLDVGGNVTNADEGTDSSSTSSLNLETGFGISVTTPGINALPNANDPATLWDFDAYGVIFSINVNEDAYTASDKISVRNIWAYNNSHSHLIKILDPHHVSLNNIASSQSISFSRQSKYISLSDRLGKSVIRKIGANGGQVTFGGVDLGDTDATGNRKKMKEHQQNATPVYIDITHTSGEKTRFYGIITAMSEDHPTGGQYPKYAITLQVSHLIELSSSGNLLSDKISIGGNISGSREYYSST
jgi:hypothetical protein